MNPMPTETYVYRHYQGNMYMVLHLATNVDTQESMVVYQDINTYKIWVRSLKSWNEPTAEGGERFTFAHE